MQKHCLRKVWLVDYRTELYHVKPIFGNSCSVITERIVSGIILSRDSEPWIAESLGLPYRTVLGIIFDDFGGGIAEPKLFWS